MQRFFSAASQNRDPALLFCNRGPGSAAHRHSASKTRVNALMAKSYALRCVRGMRLLFIRERPSSQGARALARASKDAPQVLVSASFEARQTVQMHRQARTLG